ncbi:AAA family ATPase [Helicobacter anseris]|uniref:AAA family ATPase n=1 Tax=Helicobacter anseris TaxID=375926 RepID=A0A3D8JC78_9HELI|nr:AAA family ATPase [Helicobacter anseris]RDU74444.1 AAA family ATPase [Helicobacter anseris]
MQKSKRSLYVAICGIFVFSFLLLVLVMRDNAILISQKDFENRLIENQIPSEIFANHSYIYFNLNDQIFKVSRIGLDESMLKNFKIDKKRYYSFWVLLLVFLLLIFLGLYFLRSKIPQHDSKPMQDNRDSKKDGLDVIPISSEITFNDVAGIDAAKEELVDLIDFLRNPAKYQKLNILMPKGVLLFGPPGIGKTMIAKAMANEAKVPFFYQSGSSFVQIYAGMGAKKIRELFSLAKKNAPSIIFIDEIDAVGKARGGNRSDERESTLNELLTQMDGFGDNSGVIVIGATNQADTLDEALLRSGRFDRKIHLELPSLEDRIKILKTHLRNKKYDFDVSEVAKICTGFSGANIASLINESALLSLKNGRDVITLQDILILKDKVFLGKKTYQNLDFEQKKLLGIYQASKAISAIVLGFEFEKCSLLSDFKILSDQSIVSQEFLEKRVSFYLSGIFGLKFMKNETFTLGKTDLLEAQKIIETMHSYSMVEDVKNTFEILKTKHLLFLEKYEKQILKIAEKLLEHESLTYMQIKELL